jgi:hypothetical protein
MQCESHAPAMSIPGKRNSGRRSKSSPLLKICTTPCGISFVCRRSLASCLDSAASPTFSKTEQNLSGSSHPCYSHSVFTSVPYCAVCKSSQPTKYQDPTAFRVQKNKMRAKLATEPCSHNAPVQAQAPNQASRPKGV